MSKKIKVELPKEREKKESRSIQQIQQEFGALCSRAGHLQYQIWAFEKDLELLNDQIRKLNFEAAALHAEENAKAAKAQLEKEKTNE